MKARLIHKLTTGIATGALLLASVSPALAVTASAGNDTTGAGSENNSQVVVQDSTVVVQDNQAEVNNNVAINMNTGGNSANKNTGVGDVSTGDASLGVALSTQVNSNVANVSGCGSCTADLDAGNMTTGADSENNADIVVEKDTQVFQTNYAEVNNNVAAKINTGDNTANKNVTGGSVQTGDADAVVVEETSANSNVASVGGGNGSAGVMQAGNAVTGADSENNANIYARFNTLATQSNFALVNNNAALDVNTGRNQANKNTGEGQVDTGDASVGVAFDTQANENLLDLSNCCDVVIDGGNHKTGADSENNSDVVIERDAQAFQSNCGYGRLPYLVWDRFGCAINNNVAGQLDTGNNQTNKNNQDDIVTGDTNAAVTVSSDSNSNVLGDVVFPGDMIQFPGDDGNMAWWMFFLGFSLNN